MPDPKESIDGRNALWKRRDAVLAALRGLHGGDLATEAARVARDTAASIIVEYWERDAANAPYDAKLLQQAIRVRNKLRSAIARQSKLEEENRALRQQVRAALRDLDAEARDRSGAMPSVSVGDGQKKSAAYKKIETTWRPRVEASGARVEAARAEADRLGEEAMRAAKEARCFSLPFEDDLDEALKIARTGKRIDEFEQWDIAKQLWRRFGWSVRGERIPDERVVLDRRDDAIAFTLYFRAALSPSREDDLLAIALRDQEDDKLRERIPAPGLYRGQTTFDFVCFMIWPSLEGGGRSAGPMSEEEMRRRTVLDGDVRLGRLIAAAEVAYAAVTGEQVPAGGGNDAAIGNAAGSSKQSRRGKAKRSPGRPPSSKAKEDTKLYADYKQSGMHKAEFEKERGLAEGSVELARGRIKSRAEAGKKPKKRR